MSNSIKTLIIEDEDSAVNRLKKELDQLEGVEFQIMHISDSISETVSWLGHNDDVELIFMDIHLTDGLSLEIFKQVQVPCPVIFTTAYDEYALQAFKVNSIDYLLKPVNPEELKTAVDRFIDLRRDNREENYMNQLMQLATEYQSKNFRSSFLVSFRQKMMLIDINDVAYIYVKERGVFLKKKDGKEYSIDFFLDDLEKQLDPSHFYRANRQFLVSRSSIIEIEPYFNGRLLLIVNPEAYTSVIISKEKATHFKRWADY
jgi:DNA-binding LytR/AlgR family response regulator